MSGQENTGKAEATPTDNFGTKRHNVATAMDTLNLGRGRRTNTHIFVLDIRRPARPFRM